MELKLGRSPMSIRTKLHIAESLLSSLQVMNEVDHISHCDMKPDNVVLKSGMQLLVNDFGMAIELDQSLPSSQWAADLKSTFHVPCMLGRT